MRWYNQGEKYVLYQQQVPYERKLINVDILTQKEVQVIYQSILSSDLAGSLTRVLKFFRL